ncbi:MAG: VOC family protein [Myxococcus sp.]|nr:VOC family protein [Myxococcus sp.]
MRAFFQVTLRTVDVNAARRFYAALLGGGALDVVELHEQARSRGAPPHWLPFLEVDEVGLAAEAFIARGAQALGPRWVSAAGLEAAVLRDPGGAVLALARPPPGAPRAAAPGVAWYGLVTADVERAQERYEALFGWAFEPPRALGALGVFRPFAWERGGPQVGALTDVASHPGAHPHWLVHFRVGSLAEGLEQVMRAGGAAQGPFATPSGDLVAVCEDPQGAAFALQEQAPGPPTG